MEDYPHHYNVVGNATPDSDVDLNSDNVAIIQSAPPSQFGGPGDKWSPESLLVAAVADCFILTFNAIARASKLEWSELECKVEGILDRQNSVTKFTVFHIHAKLDILADSKLSLAKRLLAKAEDSCLITNSLSAETNLQADVSVTAD